MKSDRDFSRSMLLFEDVKELIPGGSQTFSKSYTQVPFGKSPLFFDYAKDAITRDIDGNEYIDTVNSLLPIILGYQDQDVDAAIRDQLSKGITYSLASPLEFKLAKLICKYVPSAQMVRFMKNGSDATSAAIRLSRAYTGRDKIVSLGYHGWHDWYVSATTRSLGIPKSVGNKIIKLPFNDLDAVQNALEKNKNKIAAIILEPYCISEPDPGYLKSLRELCDNNSLILIFDEIVTGFRFSLGGAQEFYRVTPDLTCLGKAMANGMPISCIAGKKEILEEFENVFISGTFGGECLSIAAAIATINKLEQLNVHQKIWELKLQI